MNVVDAASLDLRRVSVKNHPLKGSKPFNGNRAQDPGPAGLLKHLEWTDKELDGEKRPSTERRGTACPKEGAAEEAQGVLVYLLPAGKCLLELLLLV